MSSSPAPPDPLQLSPRPMADGTDSADLLEALRRQDDHAVARLSARWAHRHGVEALERLLQNTDVPAPSPTTLAEPAGETSPPSLEQLQLGIVPAEHDVNGSAAQGFNPIRRLKILVRDCIDEVASTFQGETDHAKPEQESPAHWEALPPPPPVHPDLAALRSWLPDHLDDQHRRAS